MQSVAPANVHPLESSWPSGAKPKVPRASTSLVPPVPVGTSNLSAGAKPKAPRPPVAPVSPAQANVAGTKVKVTQSSWPLNQSQNPPNNQPVARVISGAHASQSIGNSHVAKTQTQTTSGSQGPLSTTTTTKPSTPRPQAAHAGPVRGASHSQSVSHSGSAPGLSHSQSASSLGGGGPSSPQAAFADADSRWHLPHISQSASNQPKRLQKFSKKEDKDCTIL